MRPSPPKYEVQYSRQYCRHCQRERDIRRLESTFGVVVSCRECRRVIEVIARAPTVEK